MLLKQGVLVTAFFLNVCFICQICLAQPGTQNKAVSDAPNILIVFTDDQGFADLGCYGSTKNKTPRLDRLASEGMRFTQFYAQSVCGPSRSALLTGRYPSRSGGWGMPANEITFAELLRNAGYQTACIGKWDVSNRRAILERMPNAQGFEYYFGTLGANDNGKVKFHENNQVVGETTDMGSLTRLYTDRAIDFLENRRDTKKPFCLYLAHTMMHTIIDASDRFKGTSNGGLYGDVVEEFDVETGRLLDTLTELGLAKNTLVIYTTDNGPWCQPSYTDKKKGHPQGATFWGDPGSLRAGKGSAYEAGSRAPCIVRWPGQVPAKQVSNAIFSTLDFLPTFANLCGFELPPDRIIDGVDQTELLRGNSTTGNRTTFVYDQINLHHVAIRSKKWKLLKPNRKRKKTYLRDFGTNDFELYDLKTDPGETRNLIAKHPELADSLKAKLEAHIKSHDKEQPLSKPKLVFQSHWENSPSEWYLKIGKAENANRKNVPQHAADTELTASFQKRIPAANEIHFVLEKLPGETKQSDGLINFSWMAEELRPRSLMSKVNKSSIGIRSYSIQFDLKNSTCRLIRTGKNGRKNCRLENERPITKRFLNLNKPSKIRLVTNGGVIQFWYNDQLVFNFHDRDPFNDGFFSLETKRCNIRFKDFSVYEL